MKAKLYINSEESTIRIEGGPNEVLFLLVDAITQILEVFFRTTSRSRWRGCPGFSSARFILWTRRIMMKIKSRVWYWLAAASGAVSLLYSMGIEGGAQLGSSISDSQFVTALCLVLAAVAFLRLGFAAQDREQNARRYGRVDRTHARTEEPDYRQNRRGA